MSRRTGAGFETSAGAVGAAVSPAAKVRDNHSVVVRLVPATSVDCFIKSRRVMG